MTTLSFRSRMTSNSYSFQPITDSSIKTWLTGLMASAHSINRSNSSRLYAMFPPVPPIVKEGRMIAGNPTVSTMATASCRLCAVPLFGTRSPIRCMACLNASRSSALWIASADAPTRVTPYFSSTPRLTKPIVVFKAVCPPMVGSKASGRSRSMTFSTTSNVIGST